MKRGIDISKWQGSVDFKKVAAGGIEFVILREGYRKTVDPRFYEYVAGARNAGIDVAAVYHFSYAQDVADVIAEAQECISNVEAAGLGQDVILFYDFEYDTVDKAKAAGVTLGKTECIQFSEAFCDYAQSCGYHAGIYTNMDYYRRMYTPETIAKYLFWLADYSGGPDVPCDIHQYTDSGRVSGIAGNVDMDYWYAEDTKGEETMAVKIGSARSNENGGINGGKAGDQTGGEVSTQNWYKHTKGWYVIRANSPEVAEIIAKTMQDLCDNNNVGYCQDHRLTGFNAAKEVGFDIKQIKKPVEIDCSEGVRICVCAAGIQTGDFYTANEAEILDEAKGPDGKDAFTVIDEPEVCNSPDLLQRGDILVTRTKGHTVVVLSNGAKVKKDESIVEGWKQSVDGERWWYQNANGTWPANAWMLINHYWYLFGPDGYMLTGWQQWDGTAVGAGDWYYLDTTKGATEGQCWHEAPGGKGALEPWYVD